jgi:hypothetical protein
VERLISKNKNLPAFPPSCWLELPTAAERRFMGAPPA